MIRTQGLRWVGTFPCSEHATKIKVVPTAHYIRSPQWRLLAASYRNHRHAWLQPLRISVHPFTLLFIQPSAYPSIPPYFHPSIHLFGLNVCPNVSIRLPSMCPSVRPSTHLSIYLTTHLSVHTSVRPLCRPSAYTSIYPYSSLYVYLSGRSSICSFVRSSIHPSDRLSIHPHTTYIPTTHTHSLTHSLTHSPTIPPVKTTSQLTRTNLSGNN